MDRIYIRGFSRYKVVAMLAPSRHRGGVTLLHWDSPNFEVKAIHQFGVNVIACQLATWERCWYIVRCCLLPGDGVTIKDVELAMT